MLSVTPKEIKNEINNKDETDMDTLKEERNKPTLSASQVKKLEEIMNKISSGANQFLWSEYICLSTFILLFSVLIYFVGEHKRGQFYTTIAFVTGALTSILCGYIGMIIATRANYRTAYKAL